MNFNHTLNKYERYLRQNNYSDNTISNYCRTIRQHFEKKDLDKITQKQINDIAIELNGKYAQNGNRQRFSAINLFCREILKKKKLHLKIPASKVTTKDVFTYEEIEDILRCAKSKNKREYAIIQTLYDCALRKMEICNLDIDDIDYTQMELKLRNTKTGKDEVVTMTSRVADAIKDYMLYERRPKTRDEKAVFVNKYGVRIGEHVVRNNLKLIAIECGIKKRTYPHMLRASCITHLLNKRVNPLTVQTHARHSDFKTTMRYNRPTQQQMRSDIEKIFVVKDNLTDEDRHRAILDKYLKGELSINEFATSLRDMRPKELKHHSEFTGYS